MNENGMFKKVVNMGVILGVAGIILSLLTYIINVELFANLWYGLTLLAVYLIVIFVLTFRYRKEEGGYLEFKNAFLYSWGVLAVAGLLGTLFGILLFNVIDPESVDVIVKATVDNAEAMMVKFGMPEDQMDQALADAEKDALGRFTAMGQIKNFFIGLIIYAVLSLIVGAVVKKKRQEMEM